MARGLIGADANDILYHYEAAHDYDPGPNLEKIWAPLVAVNFADDLVIPPEFGILARAIQRVAKGRAEELLALSGNLGGDRVSTDEQAIRSLVATWHRATAAGDVGTVLTLMAEDIVFLAAGQPPMRGRSSFERGLRGLLGQNRIESTNEIRESRSCSHT